jgi:predicted esterase
MPVLSPRPLLALADPWQTSTLVLSDFVGGKWVQRALRGAVAVACVTLLGNAGELRAEGTEVPPPSDARASKWCAPELLEVGNETCFWVPEPEGLPARADALVAPPGTLVIFLHGLTTEGQGGSVEAPRLMVRLATRYRFAALMPHGRRGIGPGRDPHVWAWPNSKTAQAEVEAEILRDIKSARAALEARVGRFEKTVVFGFSNGAYYATSLAFRDKLVVDGYAMFAGGSGNKYDAILAERVSQRVPVFVGYGTKDPDRQRQRDLIALLRRLGWKHQALAAKVGHTVAGEHIEAALRFLLQLEKPANK